MPHQPLKLSLLFLIITFSHLISGCSKEAALEPEPQYYLAQKTQEFTVRDYADYHNSQVEQLLLSDHHTRVISHHFLEEFPDLVRQMQEQNPQFSTNQWQVYRSRKVLPSLLRLHRRGHRPLEIFNFLQRARNEFSLRNQVHPEIMAGFDEAVKMLLARDARGLQKCLLRLQDTADRFGSAREKCAAGVLLGSFERFQARQNEEWYWPWIILYDFVGSLIGGEHVSVLFSGWAEMMFRDFPFPQGP